MKFIFGFVLGVIVATVGFTGVAKIADEGVHKVQNAAKEVAN